MRVGASVLLNSGRAIQSYGWHLHRPFGELQRALNSLEHYGCDEIAIIRPVRNSDSSAMLLNDIATLRLLNIMTPISFGGGIRSRESLELLVDLPIERLIFSSAFFTRNTPLITAASNLFGMQAVQCMLPFRCKGDYLEFFHSARNEFSRLSESDLEYIDKYSNEIILYDTESEGHTNRFQIDILDRIPFSKTKLIISGGVGRESVRLGRLGNIASVLIENRILHTEYSIKGFKNV